MLMRGASIRLSVALTLTSATLLMTSAYGQSPANPPGSPDNQAAAAQVSQSGKPEDGFPIKTPRSIDLDAEVATVKAENAALLDSCGQQGAAGLVGQMQKRQWFDCRRGARPRAASEPAQPAEAQCS